MFKGDNAIVPVLYILKPNLDFEVSDSSAQLNRDGLLTPFRLIEDLEYTAKY